MKIILKTKMKIVMNAIFHIFANIFNNWLNSKQFELIKMLL
jgi:hypothetical protein